MDSLLLFIFDSRSPVGAEADREQLLSAAAARLVSLNIVIEQHLTQYKERSEHTLCKKEPGSSLGLWLGSHRLTAPQTLSELCTLIHSSTLDHRRTLLPNKVTVINFGEWKSNEVI